ncbi:uncharacterized protein si:ch211-269k10.4 [Trichomycterus rosablanca]|uniref:uncharacterized protein si:ch211-269k10.4 n=1 Tax=Trichomycterus rosablanca TaxID=2290929 RepID=UPI002F35A061
MACSSNVMDKIEMESLGQKGGDVDNTGPIIKYYQATELIPSPKPPLHQLLKKEPAAWAFVQISSGVLNVGLGVVFAVVFPIENLLLTLFRVPIVTGLLFLMAGLMSTLLHRRPGLLQVEILILCVTLLDMIISGVLILFINTEKRRHEKE